MMTRTERLQQRLSSLLPLVLLAVSLPQTAYAAGGGDITSTFKYWGNFLLFCIVMFFILRKPFLQFWAGRMSDIEDQVSRGEKELAAANQRLEAAKAKVAGLEGEIAQMRGRIENELEHELKAIAEEGRLQAQRVEESAKSNAEVERRSRQESLRNQIAELVLEQAEKKLREALDENRDRDLRGKVLQGTSEFRKSLVN